jgi:hypothetical protein
VYIWAMLGLAGLARNQSGRKGFGRVSGSGHVAAVVAIAQHMERHDARFLDGVRWPITGPMGQDSAPVCGQGAVSLSY